MYLVRNVFPAVIMKEMSPDDVLTFAKFARKVFTALVRSNDTSISSIFETNSAAKLFVSSRNCILS